MPEVAAGVAMVQPGSELGLIWMQLRVRQLRIQPLTAGDDWFPLMTAVSRKG